MMLSKEEIKRYCKQILLPHVGIKGQQKLSEASVLVIGSGGLGCPVLQYLSAAGVGSIGIVDFDIVDETNLQRQVLYSNNDVGNLKAEVAASKISELNPFISVIAFTEKFNTSNAEAILSKFDIVVDCTDNFESRYLINDICVIMNKPFVYGGIYKFEGQVSVFNYNNSATYRCAFPESETSQNSADCNIVGVIGTLPGIIGTYQANEVIKIILGINSVCSNKILLINTLSLAMNEIKISRNENNWGSFAKSIEQFRDKIYSY